MSERTERTVVIAVHSALLAALFAVGVDLPLIVLWAVGALVLGFVWAGVLTAISNASKRKE
jgi:hypothetical protein